MERILCGGRAFRIFEVKKKKRTEDLKKGIEGLNGQMEGSNYQNAKISLIHKKNPVSDLIKLR